MFFAFRVLFYIVILIKVGVVVKNRIYIVTGANGFLGNTIVRKLSENTNDEIRALILEGDGIKALEDVNCQKYYGNVTKKESLKEIFTVPSNSEVIVLHCAAIVYIKAKFNPTMYDVNVNGTKNIIDKVLEINAKMVYVSSVHAIPEKENRQVIQEITDFDASKVVGQYAQTKAEIAKYILECVKERNLNACIVHPSGIIGPNDYGNSHLTQLIIDFANGRLKACVKGGYDFVDVRDVANGILSACEKGKKVNAIFFLTAM